MTFLVLHNPEAKLKSFDKSVLLFFSPRFSAAKSWFSIQQMIDTIVHNYISFTSDNKIRQTRLLLINMATPMIKTRLPLHAKYNLHHSVLGCVEADISSRLLSFLTGLKIERNLYVRLRMFLFPCEGQSLEPSDQQQYDSTGGAHLFMLLPRWYSLAVKVL